MLLFQSILLFGYAYTYASVKLIPERIQPIVHMIFLVLSLIALPIGLAQGWTVPVESQLPVFWLIAFSAMSVGVPFFILSTNAPLIQAWFARTGHKHAEDPYFLYAVSNAGSLIALLSYPFVIEPLFELSEQTSLWSSLYIAFVCVTLICAVLSWHQSSPHKKVEKVEKDIAPVCWGMRVKWVFYAFVPSSLLLGVTYYLTTDVAAVPLLWVVPLALYLITFILVFMKHQIITISFVERILPYTVLALLCIFLLSWQTSTLMSVHLIVFFLFAMLCHGRLAQNKPHASHLTEFYLWISIGGVLGGVFNALVAPAVFNGSYEYMITLFLAVLCLPRKTANTKLTLSLDIILPIVAIFLIVINRTPLITAWGTIYIPGDMASRLSTQVMLLIIFFALSRKRPLRLALGSVSLLAVFAILPQFSNSFELAKRSFFGTYRLSFEQRDYSYKLWSGNNLSVQGAQTLDPEKNLSTLYFYPLEDVREMLPQGTFNKPMASIGLGVGTIACLGGVEGQQLDFYEIDPFVRDIASDTSYFTYLSDCPAASKVIMGDGRKSIEKAADKSYGVIVLDAFSSISVPAHLLSSEAFDIYVSKLQDTGLLMVNMSNIHLNTVPVFKAQLDRLGWVGYQRNQKSRNNRRSQWMIMARDKAHLGELVNSPYWESFKEEQVIRPWTDSYSNILPLLR